MHAPRRALLVAIALALTVSSVASAGWLHIAHSIYQAEEETQKHPGRLNQVVSLTEDTKNPQFCVGYSNNLKRSNKGRLVSKATAFFNDGTEETMKFAGGVKKNFYLNCKKFKGTLAAGDTVLFEHQLKGFPRVRIQDERVEYLEVNAVVSDAGEPVLGQDAPLGLVPESGTAPLGVLPSPGPGWFHAAKSVFQAEGDNQKHPQALAQSLFLDRALEAASLCVSYSNISEDKNEGKIVAVAKVTRPDGSTEARKMAGGVKGNEFLACKEFEGGIDAGSLVDFTFELKNMPRLDVTEDTTGFADLHGMVSTSGDPVFREPPPPPAPDPEPVDDETPTNPAPTDPSPGGGNGLSAADEAAIVRFYNAKQVQFQRPRAQSPAKYMAVGPRSELLPGSGHKIDPATAGVSNSSIAAAVADYERKHRVSFPSGGSLDSATRALVAWYANMNAANGPTSVRRDIQGRYHAEYQRPSRGANTKTFSTLRATLQWLKDQGL